MFIVLFVVQQPNLSHPFHLHGYGFNVIGIGRSPDTNVKKINLKHALDLDRRGLLHRQYNLPPVKDTIALPNNGYVVLRFRADNPGKYLTLFNHFASCQLLGHLVFLQEKKLDKKKNIIFVKLDFSYKNTKCPRS